MKKIRILPIIFLSIISILALVADNDEIKSLGKYLYGIQFLYSVYILISDKKLIYLVSPPMITILYISFSFMLGSWAFENDLVYNMPNIYSYSNIQYLNISTFIMLSCNNVLFIIHELSKNKLDRLVHNKVPSYKVKEFRLLFFICLTLVTPFLFIPFTLNFLGASGDLSNSFKAITGIAAILYFALSKNKLRVFYYILIIGIFSFASYENKREAIFLAFSIVFIEGAINGEKLNVKLILTLLIGMVSLFYLIIIMSITRGYGGYVEAGDFFGATYYVNTYIQSDLFIKYFFNNIEVNYTYFHSVQAIDYVIQDGIYAYGETIIKVFFLVIPREFFPDKPSSMIDLYTMRHNPAYRLIGGSYPINIFSEYFWNFSYFSIPLTFVFFRFFSATYYKALIKLKNFSIRYSLISIFLVYNFLAYVRGAGLDLFLFDAIFAFSFTTIASFIFQALNGKNLMRGVV